MEVALRAAVEESLAAYAYQNAVFMAERLVACHPCPESTHLLATAYHAAGETHRAFSVLNPATTPRNRYLLAVCAFKLGKLQDAENALTAGTFGDVPGDACEGAPNPAYCALLLGQICRAANRSERAIEHFQLALRICPTLWVAWQNLCQLGADEAAHSYFREDAMPAPAKIPLHLQLQTCTTATGALPAASLALDTASVGTPSRPSLIGSFASSLAGPNGAGLTSAVQTPAMIPQTPANGPATPMMSALALQTPAPVGDASATPASAVVAHGNAGTPVVQGGMWTPAPGGGGAGLPFETTPEVSHMQLGAGAHAAGPPPLQGKGAPPPRRPRAGAAGGENMEPPGGCNSGRGGSGGAVVRRSARLKSGDAATPAGALGADAMEEDMPALKKQHLRPPTPQDKARPPASGLTGFASDELGGGAAGQGGESDHGGADWRGSAELCALLTQLATAYGHLSLYRSQEALDAFAALDRRQYNTGWVQAQVATAHFNMAHHKEAEAAFRRCRKLEPHRVQGMEVYSTVLWFLKREHELCFLAQEMAALDRLAPQTWCVLGNCFSLQREFETAVRFFHRAVQVDPSFTYAYTLAGHEHVSNEDFDKATVAFRDALRYDHRHYNAWYGLGTIYLKQEKYQLAEYHFRRALAINPRNSVLHCYLGMALLSAYSCEDAIDALQRAVELDRANPLARLRKAVALSQLQRNEEALEELVALQQLAPRESTVLVQMGKVQKKLGRLHEALASFNHALDLDPKSGNVIKAHIDKLQMDAAEDDSML